MFFNDSNLHSIAMQDHTLALFLRRFVKNKNWNQSLAELCESNQIDIDLFREMLHALSDPSHEIAPEFFQFGNTELIKLLQSGHEYYLKTAFVEIDHLIQQLDQSEIQPRIVCLIWKKFMDTYYLTLKHHFDEEENNIFPMAIALSNPLLVFSTEEIAEMRGKIEEFQEHHQQEKFEFSELRATLLELPHQEEQSELGRLMRYVSSLEKDLFVHDLLEDQVLIPRILKDLELKRLMLA